MKTEQIKQVLQEFIDKNGVIDLDAACEAIESLENNEALTLEKIAEMTSEQVNEHWDEVKKVLKGELKND